MSEYLQANNIGLSIAQKQDMVSVINRMVNISGDFPVKSKIDHCKYIKKKQKIWNISCKLLNYKTEELSYYNLFSVNIQPQSKDSRIV